MHIVFIEFYQDPNVDYEELALALRSRGHTAWVGSCNTVGDLIWKDDERVVDHLPGPTLVPEYLLRVYLLSSIIRRVAFFVFMIRIHGFLRQHQPDIVQVNPSNALLFWLLPLFMPGQMCFILDFRQIGERHGPGLVGRFKARINGWVRYFLATTVFQRACFLHPAGAKKVLGNNWPRWGSVVPMGVDQQFLNYCAPKVKENYTIEPVRFLYLGRLARVRRLELILHAIRLLLDYSNRFEIVFLGSDFSNGYYQKLVYELNIDSYVIIQAPVPYKDVPKIVSSFDVALAYVPEHPADWQYHPTIKILEYKALGIPIIATDFEPNRDFVKDGVNGLLVKNSVECLAEGMLRFIVDRAFLRQCQANARFMRQGVTWNEVAEMYEQQVFMPLLNGEQIQGSHA